MGRRKIELSKISDSKSRQVTFNKRKVGLIKKAMELSILCDSEVLLVMFSNSNKLFQYASEDVAQVFHRYANFEGVLESFNNEQVCTHL